MIVLTKKFLVLAFLAVLSSGLMILTKPPKILTLNSSCTIKTEKRTVRGNSMSGILADGEPIRVDFGYYSCHTIKRSDIVIYDYAPEQSPIVKSVYGIPGDRFLLSKLSDGYYHLFINGSLAKTSRGEDFIFDDSSKRMLALYEKDDGGIIPVGNYLLLGNSSTGTFDSSHFGLVGRIGIIGKVLTSN